MTVIELRQRMRGLGLNPTRTRFWLIYTMGFLDMGIVLLTIEWLR